MDHYSYTVCHTLTIPEVRVFMANEAHSKYLGAHLHSEYSWERKIGDACNQYKAIRSNVHNKVNFLKSRQNDAEQIYICVRVQNNDMCVCIEIDIGNKRQ